MIVVAKNLSVLYGHFNTLTSSKFISLPVYWQFKAITNVKIENQRFLVACSR